ncbi:MAG TPA: GNAT family N-acetyltransferase [Solirubrobacterales bacterium]|nr:GNAT family N-acetyltransferase [Solirubrobacterales bacterium]
MTSVREATLADAEAIAVIGARSWDDGFRGLLGEGAMPPERAWNLDAVRSTIESEGPRGSDVLLAERDGAACGFVLIGPSRDEDAPAGAGEIWALFVDPPAWRSGVGSRLVEAALAGLAGRGFTEATVWTLGESERNLAFYERLGFALDGATQARQALGHAREVRLRRPLDH